MTMQNRGQLVACDVSAARLDGAVRRLRRAGVHNVERHLLEPGDKWVKRRAGQLRPRAGGCALHRHRHLAAQSRCAAAPDRGRPCRTFAKTGGDPGSGRIPCSQRRAFGLRYLFAARRGKRGPGDCVSRPPSGLHSWPVTSCRLPPRATAPTDFSPRVGAARVRPGSGMAGRRPGSCPEAFMISVRRARPSDAISIGAVHVAAWRSTYPGILPG